MNAIEKCIYKARTNHELMQDVFKKLLITPFKIPAINSDHDIPDKKWHIYKTDEKAQVKTEKDKDKNEVLVAFTSDSYLKKYMPRGSYYLGLLGHSMFLLCLLNKLDGIVINPKSNLELRLSKEQLSVLVERN